jgi:hypothetical protein
VGLREKPEASWWPTTIGGRALKWPWVLHGFGDLPGAVQHGQVPSYRWPWSL